MRPLRDRDKLMCSRDVNRLLLSALQSEWVRRRQNVQPRRQRELARIMPVTARSGCLLRRLPEIAISANLQPDRGRSRAGVGSVRLGRRQPRCRPRQHGGRRVVRAGQWKLLRKGRTIAIEQMMADDSDRIGGAARVEFHEVVDISACAYCEGAKSPSAPGLCNRPIPSVEGTGLRR